VLKRPPADNYISNLGSRELVQVPVEYLNTARAFVLRYGKNCMYVRVDGVVSDGKLLLMELEMIEPHLYLSCLENLKGYENYYEALTKYLS